MERKCVPLESGYCSNLPYNITTYPNMLGHNTIEEVDMVIDIIKEVVDSGDERPGSVEEVTLAAPAPSPAGRLRRVW